MADSRWDWVESVHRYRDKASGRFVSPTTIAELRDEVLTVQREAMAELARQLAEREITVKAFERTMRVGIEETFGLQYMFGRGGRNAMTTQDRQALGELIADQYAYLRGFAEDAAAGRMTAGQIRARANLYGESGGGAYWRGRAASFDGLQLPAYPKSGSECGANCKCEWRISETDEEFTAYWVMHAQEHCATCTTRASQYNPYRQSKQSGQTRLVRFEERRQRREDIGPDVVLPDDDERDSPISAVGG